MKKMSLSFCMILLSAFVFGQARNGTAEYHNTLYKQPAAMICLPYSPNVVAEAMLHYKDVGDKPGKASSKMHQSFQNTLLIQNNVSQEDLIFKIGLKESGNKNNTAVYLMLESPIANAYSSRAVYRLDMGQAIDYLDNLAIAIHSYALDKQIIQQAFELDQTTTKQSKLIKMENKLNSRKNDLHQKFAEQDSRDGIRRKEKCERRITVNNAAQITLRNAIIKQKNDLVVLNDQQAKLQ